MGRPWLQTKSRQRTKGGIGKRSVVVLFYLMRKLLNFLITLQAYLAITHLIVSEQAQVSNSHSPCG